MRRFDLHVHTRYSKDALIDPSKILEVLDKKGLKGIAVTDHGTIRGGTVTHELARKAGSDHIIIVGSEIKTEIGDIIGLFLKEEIKSRDSMQVLDEIGSQGGVSILAHPFRGTYIPRLHKAKKVYSQDLLQKVNFIEVDNARSRSHENTKARELAHDWGKPALGGSDAHFYAEIGAITVNFENEDVNTEDDLKRSLLGNSLKIERGRILFNNFYWYALTAALSRLNKLGLR
jgi:hypothetical protein